MDTLTHACAKCHIAKPTSDFGKDKSRKSGLNPYCKQCKHADTLEYIARDKSLPSPDTLRQCTKCLVDKTLDNFYKDQSRSDGYSKICKTCKCAKVREYCQNNPEKVSEGKLLWKKTQKGKECDQRYYDNNREQINKRSRERYASDPDGITAKLNHWRIKNPEKAKAIFDRGNAMRLKRLANVEINDLTDTEWRELLIAFSYLCAYCHRSCNRLERDHIFPLSLGGNHTKSNIAPACRSCNAKKQDKDIGLTQAILLEYLEKQTKIDLEDY